jgi:hypothetical protein
MEIDKEKFKLVLALSGYILIEEPSCCCDGAYCGIMYAYDNDDSNARYNRVVVGELYVFSDNEESAFQEVYEKWTLRNSN